MFPYLPLDDAGDDDGDGGENTQGDDRDREFVSTKDRKMKSKDSIDKLM